MAYRLFLLGGHYRSQLDFTTAGMDAAQVTLRRLVARIAPLRPLPQVETLADAVALLGASARAAPAVAAAGAIAAGAAAVAGGTADAVVTRGAVDDKVALAYVEAIDAAIANDLATPKLLATLQDALRDPEVTTDGLKVVVAAADALLGLRLGDLEPAEVDQRRTADDLTPEETERIERLIAERTEARMEKNWLRADEIRAELDALGVQVTDTPAGPTWQLR
jgi:cysteinyl-tRNA synthetase